MNRLRADLLLLFTSLIWGTTFVAQKNATADMAVLSFVGARFLLSALAVVPVAVFEAKRQTTRLTGRDWVIAAVIGTCLFIGAALQQEGLTMTTATNAGFLTALYVVFVPFVVWILGQGRPRLIVVIACMISLIGAWLLAGMGSANPFALGDGLVVISDIAWALAIALVPVFLRLTHRPFLLCVTQYGITAALGLGGSALFEHVTWQGIVQAMPAILYAGLLSGGVGFTLQIIAQKHTPPAEAALIMSLESVFAALAGALLLGERLTSLALVGCILILLGVVFSETGAPMLRIIKNGREKLSRF